MLESLTPAQQVVKIVRDELAALLGEEGTELRLDGRPAVIMLCGLQGSGKTTTAGKLAKRLKKRGKHPLLVAGDLQRAAAVEQLKQVGKGVEVPVLEPEAGETVIALGERALSVARQRGHDVVIMDTAGRLHVDQALMDEIRLLADRIQPHETLFVADSMTGQDAVKSAEQFSAALPLTGVILTKLDGDSRGGAALSIRTVARVPIRFVGIGEKSDDLELFHPERMASRMIGMGDIMSLIEKAERGLDSEETQRLAQRMVKNQFTLEDLRDQLRQIRRLGPLASVLEMLPKVGPLKGLDTVERRRGRPAQGGGDHQLDDAPGAQPAGRPERQPQAPHLHGLRHLGRRDQPPPQAVQADAEDDEGSPGQVAAPGAGERGGDAGVGARC